MLPDLYCHGCDTVTSHTPVSAGEAACTGCGMVREIDADVLAEVVPMEPCNWCRETKPVGHVCLVDDTPCERKTSLLPCGECGPCLTAQGRGPVGASEDIHIP